MTVRQPPPAGRPTPVGTLEPSSLLHNIGGPPMAILRWNGLGRGEAVVPPGTLFEQATQRGTWLFCVHSLKQRLDAPNRFRPDLYRFLLECVDPGHGLNEVGSRRRLGDLLEAHTEALNWPRHLIAQPAFTHDEACRQLTIDHPLTVFVALGHSMGHLWSRDRPLKLSRLMTPILQDVQFSMSYREVKWQTSLWFPDGIPADLLDVLRKAHDTRTQGQ